LMAVGNLSGPGLWGLVRPRSGRFLDNVSSPDVWRASYRAAFSAVSGKLRFKVSAWIALKTVLAYRYVATGRC